ncbi:glycosyltransferase family 2 protein [Bariatricus sp. SGI.154]|uniref:glycosyltransferase family 2 protein n=1 Tax=Bariatricus sp. SGI.154 TaxID=3420549 RepID=UPI003CFFBB1B
MRNLLSVIVPVYNAGDYLTPLIESVLNQSYNNIEIILVDDGAKDNSGKICDEFVKIDTRVHVIHKENGGQSSARNTGLLYARGEYIAFADNDDIIHPDMYQDLITVMENTGADVCACDFENVDNNVIGDIKFEKFSVYPQVMAKRDLLNDFFKPTWRIPIWNKVYRANLVKTLHFGDYHLGEDNLFSYQIIHNCDKYVFCNHVYYFQRMHGLNYEFTAIEYMTDLLDAKEMILNEIKNCYSECYKICQKLFLYECVRVFNGYSEGENVLGKKNNILEMIKRNTGGILFSDMPIGHKKLFLEIRYTSKYSNCRIIHI